MLRTTISVLLSFGMLVACGSGSKPATQPPVAEKEHMHPKLPASVDAFHDLLSPIWHSEPGAVRNGLACEQAGTLVERATILVNDPPPAEASGKTEVWNLATNELAGLVGALAAACSAKTDDVELKLIEVHDGFHKVGATVSDMGDHDDHRPPGGTGQHGGTGEY